MKGTIVNKYFQKVKDHVKANKKVYITGGVSALIGAVAATFVILKTDAVNVDSIQILNWKPSANHLDVFVEALGDPGNVIQDTTTGTIYASQGQAARELDVTAAMISKHMTGKIPHVNGHVFDLLGKAAVPAVA
jgi:hypothetical protein